MKGKVARIVDHKFFGFIRSEHGVDYFFHHSGFDGHWDDLVKDFNENKKIEVEFDDIAGVKGPRAENVRRIDGGVVR